MSPDDYQQAWQAHSSQTRVTIDADLLLNAVQRNQQELRATDSWGAIVTIGIELLLLPVLIYMGVTLASPWTFYLVVVAVIWSAAYNLVVRARRKQTPNDPGEPLLSGVRESLELVEHQIWSQRNDFWWSQLPTALAMLTFFFHASWLTSGGRLESLGSATLFFVFVLALYGFIYYLSQIAVRKQYEPRRQELLALLASLTDETTSEVSGEYPILMSAGRVKCSRRRLLFAGVCFVVLLWIGLGGAYLGYRLDEGYPKKSPFAAVRWQESQPEVKVGDEWFKLVSLDEIPASEIVAFSQRTYGNKWRKRFEEDLVELLTRMGHPPQDTVTLVVQSLTSSETQILEGVAMTHANRQAIWDAAQARERSEQEQGK
jgi:hypothetical protein